ncbi:6-phosphogluconate dehydrogenase C-terminal domain-like protein [Clathrospora elynae]|uniref:2-dehydropantoate 2-reductase n=1 Tax=Clathrospora elynae TaxID=706981 RepID=A0A6A5T3C9_9PLEO|nr:6-phosphogluconate dehydrogenase C-terminal domain-like protein [Clathrospora elynae]
MSIYPRFKFTRGLHGFGLISHYHRLRSLASSHLPTSISPSRILPFRNISTTKTSPRVHILGLGSIGTFVAHALAETPERPLVTLLLHRASLGEAYMRNGKEIVLETREGQSITYTGYDLEVLHDTKWYTMDPASYAPGTLHTQQYSRYPIDEFISNLIVCVKSTQTVAALRPLIPRLSRTSTVVFLQNGAGMIEDANTHLWPDPSLRPTYITGVISHGVTLNGPFNITHTGVAATSIGPVPREEDVTSDPHASRPSSASPSYLLDTLPLAPILNCQTYAWPAILQLQLEKLATNAFSNPLCALADATTAYLFDIPEACRALMQEISSVILALPELQGIPGAKERFSAKTLEETVMGIVDRNRATTTSMVWDLRRGRETEVRYINGYWARRGREVGLRTPLNEELVRKVEERCRAVRKVGDRRYSTS